MKFTHFNKDNRGQLLLLAAISIVLIILGTVTLLNTAAFTDAERADGITDRSGQTLEQLSEMESAVETSIRHANHETEDTVISNHGDRTTRLGNDISVIESQLNEQFAVHGGQIIINEPPTYTEGVRIWQPGYSNLSISQVEDSGGGPDLPPQAADPAQLNAQETYGLVDGVSGIRSFTIEVTGDNLQTPSGGDPFTVRFTNHDDVYIVTDPDDPDTVVVTSDTSNIVPANTCTVTASDGNPARISFTNGKVNGKTCSVLPGTEDIESVDYDNSDNIEAAMNMVVEDSGANVFANTAAEDKVIWDSASENPSEPEAHSAVYSVELGVTVTSPSSDFTTTIRVAPQLPVDAVTGP